MPSSSMGRDTGGNQFIPGDANVVALITAITQGIQTLSQFADATGREVDLGALTIDTRRVGSQISVEVGGDLRDAP